jgi:hypothetical protein
MCQRGRTGAHSWAQSIRRQAGSPSVQFSPVNLRNFTPVLTIVRRATSDRCFAKKALLKLRNNDGGCQWQILLTS